MIFPTSESVVQSNLKEIIVLFVFFVSFSGNLGKPVDLMLSVMGRKGPSSITVGNVSLVRVSGPEHVSNSNVTDMGNGNILVTVDAVPEGEFVIALKGTDKVSNTEFLRQSTTQMSISKVTIQVCLITIFSKLSLDW